LPSNCTCLSGNLPIQILARDKPLAFGPAFSDNVNLILDKKLNLPGINVKKIKKYMMQFGEKLSETSGFVSDKCTCRAGILNCILIGATRLKS